MKKQNCLVKIIGNVENEKKVTRVLDKAEVTYHVMTRYTMDNETDGAWFDIQFEMKEKKFYKVRKKISRYCVSIEVGSAV